ncbi:MAG: 6-phosphogluconolactonase [Thiobacillus sp.]
MSLPEWRVFADAQTLVTQLADALCEAAGDAIRVRGVFHLVLAGGRTPQALYQELAKRHAGDAHWHIWYGDERCLPVDDPQRNSFMAETAWLAGSEIPPSHWQAIPAERGALAAAEQYRERLAELAQFDVVLLGVGEDGHTASLFPGQVWNGADVIAVNNAPKPPSERISLSASRLSRSQHMWFIVTGTEKREAIARWKSGERLPVSSVSGGMQTVAWIDELAAG